MPLKEDAARAVDRLDPAARVLHSVNTVSWDGDQLVGSSTDGAGFVASLAAAGVEVDGAQISVIGAGGAARSVIDALGRAGAADITVLNRTPERAEQAASLSRAASVGIGSDVTRADIVVNATSIGMGVSIDDAMDADMACDPALLRSGQVVADLVYHPLETAWMRAAADVGATTVDGLGMLVHQAALQQLRWLGEMPDTTAMRIAAEAELARR
jgi:shikimate dehydrogenase